MQCRLIFAVEPLDQGGRGLDLINGSNTLTTAPNVTPGLGLFVPVGAKIHL